MSWRTLFPAWVLFFPFLRRDGDIFIRTSLLFANATASVGKNEIGIGWLALSWSSVCRCPFVLIETGGVGNVGYRRFNRDVGQRVDICRGVVEIVAIRRCHRGELWMWVIICICCKLWRTNLTFLSKKLLVLLLKVFIPEKSWSPEKSNKSWSPSASWSWSGHLYNVSDMSSVKDCCEFGLKSVRGKVGVKLGAKLEFGIVCGYWVKFELKVVCEFRKDASGIGAAVIFVDGTVGTWAGASEFGRAGTCGGDDSSWTNVDTSDFGGDGTIWTCGGDDSGWMILDTSGFGGVGTWGGEDSGWVIVDTSESGFGGDGMSGFVIAELVGLSDFSAQSDARWRRSSCAEMPN